MAVVLECLFGLERVSDSADLLGDHFADGLLSDQSTVDVEYD